MSKGKAFHNHSVFLYSTKSTVNAFGGIDEFVQVCKELGIKAVWFRSHGTNGLYGDPMYNKELMRRLDKVGVLCAHWGWCQGKGNDHKNVNQAIDMYRNYCDTYIADIEPGVNNSKWTKESLSDLIDNIKQDDIFLAVTTFGFIPWHQPDLWKHIASRIDGWDIQAYWHNFPNQKMINQKYATRNSDPAHYCDICVAEWKKVVGDNAKIHLSGQAYWGEGGFTKPEAERQWDSFFANYNGWDEICGFGYWHLANLSESPRMMSTLKQSNVSQYWKNESSRTVEIPKTIQYSNIECHDHVKRYQEFLMSLGYDVYPDGYAGPFTSAAHKKVFGSYIQGDPRIKQ